MMEGPLVVVEEVTREDEADACRLVHLIDNTQKETSRTSIVHAVSAGPTTTQQPSLASTSLSGMANSAGEAVGTLQAVGSFAVSICGGGRNMVFESLMDRELPSSVFERMLAGVPAPFAGSPDLRPHGIDTAKNPSWLMFGWSHKENCFLNFYDVGGNPHQGDRPCMSHIHTSVSY